MTKIIIVGIVLLTGCAPTWNGFYVGIQRVTVADTAFRSHRVDNEYSLYGNAIWNLGERSSFQIQVIEPLNGTEPLLRLAVDTKLF